MDELLAYLNSLSVPQREEFASACQTTVGYLRKACSKKQLLGEGLCSDIERESNGVVTRKGLRPNDWHRIWPELSDAA